MAHGKDSWAGADLFERHPANPILTARDLGYRANVIFNAGATQVGGETVLLARVEDKRALAVRLAPGLRYDAGRFPETPWTRPQSVAS